MDIKKLERRNSSMDILRIVAAFTVLSVITFTCQFQLGASLLKTPV